MEEIIATLKKTVTIKDKNTNVVINNLTIEITKEDLFNVIEKGRLRNLDIADHALGCVSWHDNMPKSCKLEYIEMMRKHIDAFEKDLDHNNDIPKKALVEVMICPTCQSDNIKWELSATKKCKHCGCIFRSHELTDINPNTIQEKVIEPKKEKPCHNCMVKECKDFVVCSQHNFNGFLKEIR